MFKPVSDLDCPEKNGTSQIINFLIALQFFLNSCCRLISS